MNISSTLRAFTVPSMLSLAALVAGCGGSSSSSEDPNSEASQLDTANGGMTNTDEAPAFGDPQVESLPSFEDAQSDTTDPTTSIAAQPGARSFHVALLWGHLPAPADASSSDTDPTGANWTGSISVDQGAIGVRKTLAFDQGDKVEPRSDPRMVSFVSHTLPFVDGLFLHVVVPAGATTLHVRTVSLDIDVDLNHLEGDVSRIPDSSNGMGYIGYEDVKDCARGLTFGRWVKDRAAFGRLRGQVIDDAGARIGHVRGIWGHAPKHDANVFFGKYIDTAGKAHGLFGGTYGEGKLSGVWGTVDPKNAGTLEGFYSDGYDRDDGRGVYIARWSEKCQ